MVKVLFLQNMEHHNVGEVKDIPDGYARNFLLPKGIAVLATEDEVQKLEKKMEKIKAEEDKVTEKMNDLAAKIEAKPVVVEAQAGDERLARFRGGGSRAPRLVRERQCRARGIREVLRQGRAALGRGARYRPGQSRRAHRA
jgi:hypothetical protein